MRRHVVLRGKHEGKQEGEIGNRTRRRASLGTNQTAQRRQESQAVKNSLTDQKFSTTTPNLHGKLNIFDTIMNDLDSSVLYIQRHVRPFPEVKESKTFRFW